MTAPAIEMQNVTVSFGDDTILKNVSLKVLHGETLVIIGQSGAGKSVLLKTMAGIQPPTSGKVLCEGVDWQSLSTEGKHDLSYKIGMQFQKSALFDDLTSAENIAFPLKEHTKLSEAEIEKRVLECLDAVNLTDAHELYPHQLSGGMRQRLGIARAIALKPEIIFYDDPTAGLDPINSDRMAEMIIDLKKQTNSTVIIVTHDILRAYQLAGRIVLVVNQEVIETGDADQTAHHPDPRVQQFIHGSLTGPLTPS